MTIKTIYNWFKRFRAGSFDLKDESPSGDRYRSYQGHAMIVDAINISRTTPII